MASEAASAGLMFEYVVDTEALPVAMILEQHPASVSSRAKLTLGLPRTYPRILAFGGPMKCLIAKLGFALLLLSALLPAQDLASFEKRVTVKTLPNGMTFVICQRHEAPVFSFYTVVDAGSAQDPMGRTGLAHMFEHMAFKGTPDIGTTNWPAEKVALEKVEKTYAAYIKERDKRVGRDDKQVAALQKAWKDAIAEANKYVIPNQFGQIVESAGGEGLNAQTSWDSTDYMYSLPVNKFELWAYLESDRFLHPALREFYKERDVVTEERRMRTDSSPIGRLVEQFTSESFTANPYHRPTVGYYSDLQTFSATDAEHFFHTYYIPSNMVVGIVGDIDPEKAIPVIEKYFNRIPSGPKPVDETSVEPPQNSERIVKLEDTSQPYYLEGYHRPDYLDSDDAVYDVITDLLSDGRTSRLYRSMVRDKKIALTAAGFSGFPGVKYPHLFVFYALPTTGHTTKELADAIHAEIEKLKTTDVTDEELQMIKTREKANLIKQLGSNEGLADELAVYQTRYGDWRELFKSVDRIDKVSKADIRRIANHIFTENNRSVAYIETASQKGGQQ
jgi:predicted Zn-dependent peptidase